MHLRPYQPTDLPAVFQLFRTTVERVNWRDYSPAQLIAWQGPDDAATRARWQATLTAHQTLVAVVHDQVVGFADMTTAGFLDRLYVDYAHQGRGIASILVRTLEAQTVASQYTTHASLTARGFFERQGYQPARQNLVPRGGQDLLNWTMIKPNPAEQGR